MQHRKPIKPPPLPLHSQPSNYSKQFYSLKFIFISMTSLLSITLLFVLLFFSVSSASRHHRPPHTPTDNNTPVSNNIIQQACKASRDPPLCQASLTGHVPDTATAAQVINAALSVVLYNLKTGRVLVQQVLDGFKGNKNGTTAGNNCLELLRYSEYRINLTVETVPRGKIKDGRAWMSSALVYQYDSWSALKYVNTSSLVGKTMAFLNDVLIASSSNVLGMMMNYDVFGENGFGSWAPPKTERDGFWEPGSGYSGSWTPGGVPSGMKADVTVCKSGCNYKSVQEAVIAAPDNSGPGQRFVIWIQAGVYEETVRIPLEKKNVVFLGDGMGKTVITGSMNVGQEGVTTYNSATVGVIGDGFMASYLTIQNTAGPDAHQAVAFRSDSDLSIIQNCEFLGNQDTLYAHSLRQYYKSCRIQGNVDFIFGNSASFFQDCTILVASRQLKPEKGETNALTAHGRIDPAQSTGFVFQNCVINGTDAYVGLYKSNPKVHKNFLGRPWKQYSRTVFVECVLEAIISPNGWLPWTGDFALSTLFYGEYKNSGAGSNTSGRVNWSSQIPAEHVQSYSVQNFIQGNQWIPSAGKKTRE